jgi:enoyl-CoA hydratase
MEKPVLLEIEDRIALITLNRPEIHNAINRELLRHLITSLREVKNHDEIRVAILTGKGTSFCSGVDLKAVTSENIFDPFDDGTDLPDVIHTCKKPIIGAINGHAITGGFEIALNCDFLIASEKASFQDTHARLGARPGWGMTQFLQQAVGQRMAKQISFTCQPIPAQQALDMGLVNEVVPHEQLVPRAKEIASHICNVDQVMLATIKELITYRNDATLQEAFTHERKGFKEIIAKRRTR